MPGDVLRAEVGVGAVVLEAVVLVVTAFVEW